MIGDEALELLAAVLAAAIGVMQQRIGFAPSPDRHHECIGDELCGHARAHRPADHAAREQVDDGRDIEPAFRRPHVGEVGNPFAIGGRRLEAAIEHVRSDGAALSLTQIRWQTTPSRTGLESLLPHQSLDPVQAARQPFGQQVVPHPPGAVGPITRQEAGANPCAEVFIASATLTARSCQPGIEPTSRDTERPAQPIRRPGPPVLRNEGELHVTSFAK